MSRTVRPAAGVSVRSPSLCALIGSRDESSRLPKRFGPSGRIAYPMETPLATEASAASCLVVTGMHRSGTSLLASFVRAAGINLGETFYPADGANPLGYFEDLEILEMQRKMMLACTLDESGWRDWGWTESQRLDFSRLPGFRSTAEALARRRLDA